MPDETEESHEAPKVVDATTETAVSVNKQEDQATDVPPPAEETKTVPLEEGAAVVGAVLPSTVAEEPKTTQEDKAEADAEPKEKADDGDDTAAPAPAPTVEVVAKEETPQSETTPKEEENKEESAKSEAANALVGMEGATVPEETATPAKEEQDDAPKESTGETTGDSPHKESTGDDKTKGESETKDDNETTKEEGGVKEEETDDGPPLPPLTKRKFEVLKRPQDESTVVTRNGKTWNQMLDALVAYKEANGNTMVPDRYKNEEGVCLGLWVRNQRRRKDSLTEEQQKRLSDLGLDWQTQNERFDNVWHERYAKLTEYRLDHGDCRVPYTYKPDPALAKWVSQQRAQQAQGRLAPDRKAKLDAIDFSWKLNTVKNRNTKTEDTKWHRQYEKLVKFHAENGHCKVPDRYKPDRPLGTWVKKQRLAHACGQLKEDREKMLNDLGFVWRITDKTDGEKWTRMFEKLKDYKEENGGLCHVSRTVPSDDLKPLARWIKTQRALYKSGKILPDRKAQLEAINFVWDGTQLPVKRKRKRQSDDGEKKVKGEPKPKKAKGEESADKDEVDDEETDEEEEGEKPVSAKKDSVAATKKAANKNKLPTAKAKTADPSHTMEEDKAEIPTEDKDKDATEVTEDKDKTESEKDGKDKSAGENDDKDKAEKETDDKDKAEKETDDKDKTESEKDSKDKAESKSDKKEEGGEDDGAAKAKSEEPETPMRRSKRDKPGAAKKDESGGDVKDAAEQESPTRRSKRTKLTVKSPLNKEEVDDEEKEEEDVPYERSLRRKKVKITYI